MVEPSCPACHGTQGGPAALPCAPASPLLSSHLCLHAVCLTAENRHVSFPLFLHGERIAGMQGSPSATGCLIFFSFLLAPQLREVLPASERLPGCVQPCEAAAKSSLLRIPSGMEEGWSQAAQHSSAASWLGQAELFPARLKAFVTSSL